MFRKELNLVTIVYIAFAGSLMSSSAVFSTTKVSWPRTWQVFIGNGLAKVDLSRFDTIPSEIETAGRTVKAKQMSIDGVTLDFKKSFGRGNDSVAVAFATLRIPGGCPVHPCNVPAGASADYWMDWYADGKRIYTTASGKNSGNGTNRFSLLDHTFDIPVLGDTVLLAVRVTGGRYNWFIVCGGPPELAAEPRRLAARDEKYRQDREQVLRWADSSIDVVRKGTIIIKGKPGTAVELQQTRHAFHFGGSCRAILSAPERLAADSAGMADSFVKYFNAVHAQPRLPWPIQEDLVIPDSAWKTPDRVFKWIADNRLYNYGFGILYGQPSRPLPQWALKLDRATKRKALQQRYQESIKRYAPLCSWWIIANESMHWHWFEDSIDAHFMDTLHKWGIAANPNTRFYTNEFGILNGAWVIHYARHVRDLLSRGVKLSAIGCQGHMVAPVDPAAIKYSLDTLARLGLPIVVSEFDIEKAGDSIALAQYYTDMLRVLFAHPSVNAILYWTWWGNDGLWTAKGPTLTGRKFMSYAYDKWWTRWSGKIGRNGEIRVPAFYGTYQVEVKDQTRTASFSREEKVMEVKFD